MKRDPIDIARTIAIKREINEAAERWLIGIFRRWWEEGGDPARLRARVLQPLAGELANYRDRIVELESALGESLRQIAIFRYDLAAARENSNLQKGAAAEYCDLFDALSERLLTIWAGLSKLPGDGGAGAVVKWMDRALAFGVGRAILEGPYDEHVVCNE